MLNNKIVLQFGILKFKLLNLVCFFYQLVFKSLKLSCTLMQFETFIFNQQLNRGILHFEFFNFINQPIDIFSLLSMCFNKFEGSICRIFTAKFIYQPFFVYIESLFWSALINETRAITLYFQLFTFNHQLFNFIFILVKYLFTLFDLIRLYFYRILARFQRHLALPVLFPQNHTLFVESLSSLQ